MTQNKCGICKAHSCKTHCPYCGAFHFTINSRPVYVNRDFVAMARGFRRYGLPRIYQEDAKTLDRIARALTGRIYHQGAE
jgi:hypothetical protein